MSVMIHPVHVVIIQKMHKAHTVIYYDTICLFHRNNAQGKPNFLSFHLHHHSLLTIKTLKQSVSHTLVVYFFLECSNNTVIVRKPWSGIISVYTSTFQRKEYPAFAGRSKKSSLGATSFWEGLSRYLPITNWVKTEVDYKSLCINVCAEI